MESTDSQDKYTVSFNSDTSESESDSENELSVALEKDTMRPGGPAVSLSADKVVQNGLAGRDLDVGVEIRIASDLQSSTCTSGTKCKAHAQLSKDRDFGNNRAIMSPAVGAVQLHLDQKDKEEEAKSSSNIKYSENQDVNAAIHVQQQQQQQQQQAIAGDVLPATFIVETSGEETVKNNGRVEMEAHTTNGSSGVQHERREQAGASVVYKKEASVVSSSGGELTNGIHNTCNGVAGDAAETGEVGAPWLSVGARISHAGSDQNGLAGLEGSRTQAKHSEAPGLHISAGNDALSSTETSFSPAYSSSSRSSSDVEARARKFLLATAPLAAAALDDQTYTAAAAVDATTSKPRLSESGKREAEAEVQVVEAGKTAPVSDTFSSSSASETKESAAGKVTEDSSEQQSGAERTEAGSQSVHYISEKPTQINHTKSKMEDAETEPQPTLDGDAVVGEPLGEVQVKIDPLDAKEISELQLKNSALQSSGGENEDTLHTKVENGTDGMAIPPMDKSSASPAPEAETASFEDFPAYDRKSTDDLIRRILEEARGLGKPTASTAGGSRYKVDMGDNAQVDDFGSGQYEPACPDRPQPSLLDRRLAAMRQGHQRGNYFSEDQDTEEEVGYRRGRGWTQRRHFSDTSEYATDYPTEFLGTDYRPGMYASTDYRYNDSGQTAMESDIRSLGFRQRPASSWRKKQKAFDDEDGDFLMEYSGAGSGGRISALPRYGTEFEPGAEEDADVFDEPRQEEPGVPYIPDEDFVPRRREETDEVIKEKTTEVRGMVERQSDVIKELKRASKSFDDLNEEIRELRQSLIENEVRRCQMEEEIVTCDREFKETKKQQVDLGARKYAPPGYDYTADFLSEYKPTYGRTSKLASELEVSASSVYRSRGRQRDTGEEDSYLSGYRKPAPGSYRTRSHSLYDDFGPGEEEREKPPRGSYGAYGNEEAPPGGRYGRYGDEDKPPRGKYGNYGDEDVSTRGRYGAYGSASYANTRADTLYDSDRSSRLSRFSRSATVAADYGSTMHSPTYRTPQPAPTTSRFLKKVRERKASGAENPAPKSDKPFQSRFLRKSSMDSNISSSSSTSFRHSSGGSGAESNAAASGDKPSTAESVATPSEDNTAEAAAN